MNTIQAYDSLAPVTAKSKLELDILVQQQAEEIIEAGSSEQAFAFLAKIKYLVTQLQDKIRDNAINEIERGNNSAFGVKMKIKSKSNFSFKNDATLQQLEKDKKQQEAFLKSLKEKTIVVDDDTGETKEYYPPIVTRSEYIECEF